MWIIFENNNKHYTYSAEIMSGFFFGSDRNYTNTVNVLMMPYIGSSSFALRPMLMPTPSLQFLSS